METTSLFNPSQLHKLITKEDGHFYHIHKILGGIVLGHFCYRLWQWWVTGKMWFGRDLETLAWIVVHAGLHVSSFEFVIPSRRIKSYNIIWPEFRFHSLIFAYRSLIAMVIMWGIVDVRTACVARGLLVIITIVLADIVTQHYKKIGLVETNDSTMRGNPYPTWFPKNLIPLHNLFYSSSQVLATMQILSSKDIAFPFVMLMAIQTAPFCMTLVKKGIIDQTGWHVYYTIALGLSYLYGSYGERLGRFVPSWLYWLIASGLMAARFSLRLNKYFIWGSVVLIHTVWVFMKY